MSATWQSVYRKNMRRSLQGSSRDELERLIVVIAVEKKSANASVRERLEIMQEVTSDLLHLASKPVISSQGIRRTESPPQKAVTSQDARRPHESSFSPDRWTKKSSQREGRRTLRR